MKVRAISPVIATLLLILIAVAAAVLVYVWVTGYASSMTKAGTPELEERIKVDTVSVKQVNSTNYYDVISVIPRNIGSTTVKITAVYIVEAKSNKIVVSVTGFEKELTSGNTANITIALAYDGTAKDQLLIDDNEVSAQVTDNTGHDGLSKGVTYIAKVVTENGVEAALSFIIRT